MDNSIAVEVVEGVVVGEIKMFYCELQFKMMHQRGGIGDTCNEKYFDGYLPLAVVKQWLWLKKGDLRKE